MHAETDKFPLGTKVITLNALSALNRYDVVIGLRRHAACDWGECCPDDARENDLSLTQEGRLLSVYRDRNGKKFWIITEADRSTTTVLLPEDY